MLIQRHRIDKPRSNSLEILGVIFPQKQAYRKHTFHKYRIIYYQNAVFIA